jgi:hypothetical protein
MMGTRKKLVIFVVLLVLCSGSFALGRSGKNVNSIWSQTYTPSLFEHVIGTARGWCADTKGELFVHSQRSEDGTYFIYVKRNHLSRNPAVSDAAVDMFKAQVKGYVNTFWSQTGLTEGSFVYE